jgi:hypothetical protein
LTLDENWEPLKHGEFKDYDDAKLTMKLYAKRHGFDTRAGRSFLSKSRHQVRLQ